MTEGQDFQSLAACTPRPPGRKRQRVSVACRLCRTRKSRCDGSLPCSTCSDLGGDCCYEQPSQSASATTNPSNGDIPSSLFYERLQAIEKKLDSLGRVPSFPLPTMAQSSGQHMESPGATPEASIENDNSPNDDGVDGMAAVTLKDGGDQEEYFGESSNVAFLRFIAHAINQMHNTTETTHQQITENLSQNNGEAFACPRNHPGPNEPNGHRRRLHGNPSVLPPREDADFMVDLYFTTVNLMIPCIHEDLFREMYQYMWRCGPEKMSKPWLGSLYLILAIANNVTTPTSPHHRRAADSSMFYERAIQSVSSFIFGSATIEMVQVFLLAVTYLEGTTSSSSVWTFHSMAIKTAYQLGLHSMSFTNLSDVDREIRRRLWYWCVMNDRLLSAAYGRPPLVPLSHVRLEDCSPIAFSNIPRSTLSSSLAYFNALMSLTHIKGSAVDQIYGQNLGFPNHVSMSESVRYISDLRWQLAQWQDNLPQLLKPITYDETLNSTPLFLETTRLRVLLSLRYLGTRILVLRPVLRQLLELAVESTSSRSKYLQSYGIALIEDLVHGCRDVLELSKKILIASRDDKNLLGAWWFSCYYTFIASLAVVGVLLLPKTFTHVQNSLASAPTELRAMLDTAMEILYGLDGGSKTIMRCRDTLTQLLSVVDSDGDTAGFLASSLTLSPSSLWAWQELDPGLLGIIS